MCLHAKSAKCRVKYSVNENEVVQKNECQNVKIKENTCEMWNFCYICLQPVGLTPKMNLVQTLLENIQASSRSSPTFYIRNKFQNTQTKHIPVRSFLQLCILCFKYSSHKTIFHKGKSPRPLTELTISYFRLWRSVIY